MAQIIKKFIGNDQVDSDKILLANNTNLKARNAANNADLDVIGLDSSNNVNVYDGVGNVVVDCGTKQLFDVSGNESVKWELRQLVDAVAGPALDYSDGADVHLINHGLRLPNNTNLKARNAANNADLDLIKIDATNDVIVGSGSIDIVLDSGDSNSIFVDALSLVLRDVDGATAPKLVLNDADQSANIGVQAPSALTASWNLTLPDNAGTNGYVLITDGTGITSWVADSTGNTPAVETFTLIAGDITNQYITLANTPVAGSVHFMVKGAPVLLEGASHEYSVAGAQVNFLNDIATAGPSALIVGDIVQVKYMY